MKSDVRPAGSSANHSVSMVNRPARRKINTPKAVPRIGTSSEEGHRPPEDRVAHPGEPHRQCRGDTYCRVHDRDRDQIGDVAFDLLRSLGEVMQAASAFTIVQAAFNWLVDNYPRLADWTASAVRVSALMVSLDNLERAESGDGVGRIVRAETHGTALRLRNLSVTLDDGTEVVKDAEVAIAPGERVLVAGESGTGKSTLVRAIAGLWPWGEGDIQVESGAKMLLLPQRALTLYHQLTALS